jgi:hypothetical protein
VPSCVNQYPILSFLTRKKSLASNSSFSSNHAPSISYSDDDNNKGKIVQGRFVNKHFSVDDGAEEQKFTSGASRKRKTFRSPYTLISSLIVERLV